MYDSVTVYGLARDDGVREASGVEGEAMSGIEHQSSLPLGNTGSPALNAVSPFAEMGAYEAIWAEEKVSFKALAERFAAHPGHVPSDFVPAAKSTEYARSAMASLAEAGVHRFGIRLNGAAEYPSKLRDAAHPVELLYYVGIWDFAWSPSVAVVGTRKPSSDGLARTRKLARSLVEDNFTVVSGLASGIDTAAHEAAMECGGRTIAVLGTPLSKAYPSENAPLQQRIAKDHLVVSQVPVKRYEKQSFHGNRLFFPERNATMSALTDATVIVEAGDTSGTLIQAKAALEQGRKLFVLDSYFGQGLRWPERLEAKGAMRVRNYGEIAEQLAAETTSSGLMPS